VAGHDWDDRPEVERIIKEFFEKHLKSDQEESEEEGCMKVFNTSW
jgi:hypothetical protein